MENLLIPATDITPKISFNIEQKVFELSGESRPENVRDFFDPILLWVNEYFSNLQSKDLHTFNIKLEYFNSSSAKYLLTLLKSIGLFYKEGANIEIDWYFEEGDDDMKEVGEQMSEMAKIPFKFIATEEL
ncbi:MAG: DUF1987 domain-containing protein [Bacteroidales bacterium]